jgi:hypothetical protein
MSYENWREIANAIQKETDSEKLSRLVAELCQALDDQDHQRDAKEEVSTTLREPGPDGKERETKDVKEVAHEERFQEQRLQEWRQRYPGDRLQR